MAFLNRTRCSIFLLSLMLLELALVAQHAQPVAAGKKKKIMKKIKDLLPILALLKSKKKLIIPLPIPIPMMEDKKQDYGGGGGGYGGGGGGYGGGGGGGYGGGGAKMGTVRTKIKFDMGGSMDKLSGLFDSMKNMMGSMGGGSKGGSCGGGGGGGY